MVDDCKEVLDRLSTYFSMSVCLCIFRLDTGGSAVRILNRLYFHCHGRLVQEKVKTFPITCAAKSLQLERFLICCVNCPCN